VIPLRRKGALILTDGPGVESVDTFSDSMGVLQLSALPGVKSKIPSGLKGIVMFEDSMCLDQVSMSSENPMRLK
jgi:hypothetical protein